MLFLSSTEKLRRNSNAVDHLPSTGSTPQAKMTPGSYMLGRVCFTLPMIVSTGTLAHVASNTLAAGGQLRLAGAVAVALFNTKQDSKECQGY